MASSEARSSTYFGISSHISRLTALRFSGWLKMIQPIAPSFSIKSFGVSLMGCLLVCEHDRPIVAGVSSRHHTRRNAMHRRQFLRLGAVASGVVALGGLAAGRRVAAQSPTAVPTVDRLILTNVVDNVYDVFARGSAKLDTITVQPVSYTHLTLPTS